MNPTEEPDNASAAPAIQLDSLTSIQPFRTLLARYKARVYERYGNEIVRMGETAEFPRLKGIDPTAADQW